jgi:hypothetical protein
MNQVEAKLKIATKELGKIDESIEKVMEDIAHVKKKLDEKSLPSDIVDKVKVLLDEASALVKDVQQALSRGDFDQVNPLLAKAMAAIKRAEDQIKAGGKETHELEEKAVDVEAEVKGKTIKVKIENEGSEAITILSIRVVDSQGSEVKTEWSTQHRGTLLKDEDLEVRGTCEFLTGQDYKLVIEIKGASDPETFTMTIPLVEEGEKEKEEEKRGEDENQELNAEVEIEQGDIELEINVTAGAKID